MKKPESNVTQKRILLVDDHPMTRNGIAVWIRGEPDLTVCAEAESAEQALDALSKCKPDLVLTDITMPGKGGIELVKDIQTLRPELPVLVVSMHAESLYAERVLRAGARGYIMKHEGGDKLLKAIRHVFNGRIYVSDALSERILDVFSGGRRILQRMGVEQLSDREFEVFRLIGEGFSAQNIGKRLHLSPKTIDAHRAKIKNKLGIKGGTELISYAARWSSKQPPEAGG